MCGRYTLKPSPARLREAFGLDEEPTLEARYNIAPTQAAPIITNAAPHQLTLAR